MCTLDALRCFRPINLQQVGWQLCRRTAANRMPFGYEDRWFTILAIGATTQVDVSRFTSVFCSAVETGKHPNGVLPAVGQGKEETEVLIVSIHNSKWIDGVQVRDAEFEAWWPRIESEWAQRVEPVGRYESIWILLNQPGPDVVGYEDFQLARRKLDLVLMHSLAAKRPIPPIRLLIAIRTYSMFLDLKRALTKAYAFQQYTLFCKCPKRSGTHPGRRTAALIRRLLCLSSDARAPARTA